MNWYISHRADPLAKPLADRHYTRQNPNSPQFVPPGRCLVLRTANYGALWVTSFPYAQYVRHRWAGAWICSLFRREAGPVASELITDAISATRAHFGEPPDLGMVTFVNTAHVWPTKVRGREVYGWTYLKAGFEPCGETKSGLLAFQILPGNMPAAIPALI